MRPALPSALPAANARRCRRVECEAVVADLSEANTNYFFLSKPSLSIPSARAPARRGQGEFDNVHIHPWVGSDDPTAAKASSDQNHALIEVPLAPTKLYTSIGDGVYQSRWEASSS
jgi:hypothetical protein